MTVQMKQQIYELAFVFGSPSARRHLALLLLNRILNFNLYKYYLTVVVAKAVI